MRYNKAYDFEVKELKEEKSSGFVSGFASTFGNVDLDGDVIKCGAFSKSLDNFKSRNKKIPLLFSHQYDEPIGGFDPHKMSENEKGLTVFGEIDLETQRGREVYSLTRKGFLSSFSIGFTSHRKNMEFKDNGEKLFKEVSLHEISIVAVPANPEASISEVKTATPYKNLAVAPDDTDWSKTEAVNDIKSATDSEDSPSKSYKNYFMWYDVENPEDFGSYKLPYAKNVGGELKAVPKALSSIVAALNGARGGVSIPDSDRNAVKSNVTKYYKKMGKDDPFSSSSKSYVDLLECIKYWKVKMNFLKLIS